jgi:hypothetical protein
MKSAAGAVCIVVLAFASSCVDAAGPTAVCPALVNVQGVLYTLGAGIAPVPAGSVSAEAVHEVTAQRPCIDVNPIEGDNVLQPGESNFLAEGTKLHAVEGYAAEERLAFLAFPDGVDSGEWNILVPLQ